MSLFSQIRDVARMRQVNPSLELEQRLATLRLDAIKQIEMMSKTDGWLCISDEISRELRQSIKRIYNIAELEGKDNERAYLKGRCEAFTTILATVEKWKNKEAIIRREVEELLQRTNN